MKISHNFSFSLYMNSKCWLSCNHNYIFMYNAKSILMILLMKWYCKISYDNSMIIQEAVKFWTQQNSIHEFWRAEFNQIQRQRIVFVPLFTHLNNLFNVTLCFHATHWLQQIFTSMHCFLAASFYSLRNIFKQVTSSMHA